jgi:hypothetical protein
MLNLAVHTVTNGLCRDTTHPLMYKPAPALPPRICAVFPRSLVMCIVLFSEPAAIVPERQKPSGVSSWYAVCSLCGTNWIVYIIKRISNFKGLRLQSSGLLHLVVR